MKGHIFILLEEFIAEAASEETLYAVLDNCLFDTSTAFVKTDNYPDEHLTEFVNQAIAVLEITLPQAHFAFGQWLYPRLIKMLPAEFTDFDHPSPVLANLDQLHKVELKKLYPDAQPPSFNYHRINNASAELIYHSKRQMFDLVLGVLQGMADHYKVPIDVTLISNWNNDSNCAKYELHYRQSNS